MPTLNNLEEEINDKNLYYSHFELFAPEGLGFKSELLSMRDGEMGGIQPF